MLVHPTVDRLRALGLAAMADGLTELQNNPEAAGMPNADWLGLLVDREVTARDNRRITRRLTSAKLRQAATIENVDYRTARGLDRSLFQNLGTCQWIRDANHLVIVGPTGTGKSWLACALGNKACRDGWIASSTMLIASSSRATVCGVKPAKRKSREHLAHDRPAGPQAPPMDRRNDLRNNQPALTKRPFLAQIDSSAVFVSSDRHHLDSVITILWNA